METAFNSTSKNATIGRIVFLLLSLPLGILYFTAIITGFSLGVGTLVIWIGLPILFATLFLVRGLAEMERRMVSSLLRMPMPYQSPEPHELHQGFLKRFGKILTDPYTWTSMIYMLLKLPLGILNFTLVVALVSVSLSLTFMPLAYLINLLVNTTLLANGITGTDVMIPGFIVIHGYFDPVMFIRSFLGIPVGLLFWVVTSYIINALALVSGELARALLGPGVAPVVTQPHTASYVAPGAMEEQQVYVD